MLALEPGRPPSCPGRRSGARPILAAAAILGVLGGCSPVDVVATGEDRYRLELRRAWYAIPPPTAVSELGREALEVCPRGYERERDLLERDAGGLVAVWDVRCR